MKNSRSSVGTSERAMKPASSSAGRIDSVCSAVSRISVSASRRSASSGWPSCSSGRGAMAPCAASSLTSRATSPRRKKSSSGVLSPASAINSEPGNPGSRRGRCGPRVRRQGSPSRRPAWPLMLNCTAEALSPSSNSSSPSSIGTVSPGSMMRPRISAPSATTRSWQREEMVSVTTTGRGATSGVSIKPATGTISARIGSARCCIVDGGSTIDGRALLGYREIQEARGHRQRRADERERFLKR